MTKLANSPAALSQKDKEAEFENIKRRIHTKLVDKLDLSRVGELEGPPDRGRGRDHQAEIPPSAEDQRAALPPVDPRVRSEGEAVPAEAVPVVGERLEVDQREDLAEREEREARPAVAGEAPGGGRGQSHGIV